MIIILIILPLVLIVIAQNEYMIVVWNLPHKGMKFSIVQIS